MLFIVIFGSCLGILIALCAQQKRGFGTTEAILGGILLGPLAVLLYFAPSDKKKCERCMEWIHRKATICPHCRSQVPEEFSKTKNLDPPNYEKQQKIVNFIGASLLIIMVFIGVLRIFEPSDPKSAKMYWKVLSLGLSE